MSWLGAVATGAGLVSAIAGMRRGDGGLSTALAAINVQLEGLIEAQTASLEALRQIGFSLAALHAQVQNIGNKVAQSEFTFRAATHCITIANDLQLIEKSAGDRHHALVTRVAQTVSSLRHEVGALSQALRAGDFNAAPYFAATNSLAVAGTVERFLSSKQLLTEDVADHLPFIVESAIEMLEYYAAPGAGVSAEVDAIKAAMHRTTSDIGTSGTLHCDRTLWRGGVDDFADLTDESSTRPRTWPWNLHRQEHVLVNQEAKILVPEGRYLRTAVDATYYSPVGREGHESLHGYKDEEYAHRIHSYAIATRVSSIAGRSTLIEVERVDLGTTRKSDWRYHHRKKVGTRTRGPVVWTEGNEPLVYLARDGERLIAAKVSEKDFSAQQESFGARLAYRNSLALVLAFYLQIREGAQSTLAAHRELGGS